MTTHDLHNDQVSLKLECICLLDPGSDLEELYDSSVTKPASYRTSVYAVTQKTHLYLSEIKKSIKLPTNHRIRLVFTTKRPNLRNIEDNEYTASLCPESHKRSHKPLSKTKTLFNHKYLLCHIFKTGVFSLFSNFFDEFKKAPVEKLKKWSYNQKKTMIGNFVTSNHKQNESNQSE